MRDRKALLLIISEVCEHSLDLKQMEIRENASLRRDLGLNDLDLIELLVGLDIRLHVNLSERYLHHILFDDTAIYNLIDILEWIPEVTGSPTQWKVEVAQWLAGARKIRKKQQKEFP